LAVRSSVKATLKASRLATIATPVPICYTLRNSEERHNSANGTHLGSASMHHFKKRSSLVKDTN